MGNPDRNNFSVKTNFLMAPVKLEGLSRTKLLRNEYRGRKGGKIVSKTVHKIANGIVMARIALTHKMFIDTPDTQTFP